MRLSGFTVKQSFVADYFAGRMTDATLPDPVPAFRSSLTRINKSASTINGAYAFASSAETQAAYDLKIAEQEIQGGLRAMRPLAHA